MDYMGQTLAFADRTSLLSFAPGVWVGTVGKAAAQDNGLSERRILTELL